MEPVEPEQPEGMIRLYHGTTDEAAERILRSGFQVLDRNAVAEEVAHEHGLTVDDVLSATTGTFLDSLGRHDEDFVSFGYTAMGVEFWARIGGEARWECLKAAYVHKHPGSGIDDREPTEWAEGPTDLHHSPTVVTIDVPYDHYQLIVPNAEPSYGEWLSVAEMLRLGRTAELTVPIPFGWISGSIAIERAWCVTDVAARLGISWDAVHDQIRSGALPPSDNYRGGETRWWESTILPRFESE